MIGFMIFVMMVGLMNEVLAEPAQVANVDENGEIGTVTSPSSRIPASIPFTEIIALANLVLAIASMLITYWIGRKYSP